MRLIGKKIDNSLIICEIDRVEEIVVLYNDKNVRTLYATGKNSLNTYAIMSSRGKTNKGKFGLTQKEVKNIMNALIQNEVVNLGELGNFFITNMYTKQRVEVYNPVNDYGYKKPLSIVSSINNGLKKFIEEDDDFEEGDDDFDYDFNNDYDYDFDDESDNEFNNRLDDDNDDEEEFLEKLEKFRTKLKARKKFND